MGAFRWVLLLILQVAACRLVAQVNSSTVTGTVTDSSGARVAGAKVLITNQATGVSVSTVTTGTGEYTAPYLIAGTYRVQVIAAGFASQLAENAPVGNNATVHVDVVLKTGGTETIVQVDAGAAALQTDDTTVKTTIDALQIDALPNINQNPLLYATLQPGVAAEKSAHQTQSTDSFGIGPHARRVESLISVNGGLGFTTDIQLDGIPILASDYNEEGITPNQESIQEVQVQSNTFSSEYGRGTGIVEYFSKSGTNALHGEVVYRNRNEAFNANGYGNNFNHFVSAQTNPATQTGVRGPFKINYFGGSLGGPIIKDKLFFFASYEGLKHVAPINKNITVPTMLERNGDFSCTKIQDNNGNPVPVTIYNPYTATQVAPNVYERALFAPGSANCAGSGNFGGGGSTVGGGSAIPAGNLDAVGVKVYSNYPLPNQAASDVYGNNNYNVNTTQNFLRNTGQIRVDYKLNSRNSIYATGGISEGSVIVPNFLGPNNPFYPNITWGQTITDNNPYAAIGDTVIFSPTLVLDVRYGVNRMQSIEGYGPKSGTFDNSPYQQPAAVQSLVNDPSQPFDFCPGSSTQYTCLNYTVGQHINEHQTNHSAVASITKTHGSFTFKVGGEYRVGLLNTANPVHANFEVGNYYSDQNYTSQYTDANGNNVGSYNTTNVQQGFPAAQWLTGAGYEVAASSVASALAMKYGAFYEQTTWKATPKLTLNFGLRFELQPGPTERHNQQSAFDTEGTNPYGKGSYVFSGTNGYSRNLYLSHYNDYGPRFGVAYNLDSTTVIRGGFGIAYLPTNSGFGFTSQNNTAFTTHNVASSSAVFGANPNGIPIGKFYDGQVSGNIVPALGSDTTNPLQYGGSNSYLQDYRSTYDGRLLQWNVFFEKSFTPSTIFSLGYSASNGDRLPFSNVPVNGLGANGTGTFSPPGFQTISPALLASWRQSYISSNGTNPGTLPIANPYHGNGFQGGALSAATVPAWRLQVPYPEFPDLNLLEQKAHSNYQSLIAEVRHTLSKGIQFDASYVWSKEIDDTQNIGQSNDAFNNAGEQNTGYLLNLNDPYENRHVGYNDIPNRVVVTALFESPFGRNRQFLANSKAADLLLGGWRLGTSFQAQTGTPIEISSSMGSLNNRPNRVPGVNPILPKSERHFFYNPKGGQTIQLPGLDGGGTANVTCTGCMPYLNPLAFAGPTVTTPNGKIEPDIFWYGNSRVAFDDIRSPNNIFFDAQLQRDFRITERVHFSVAANAFNVLNLTQFTPIQAIGVGGINTSSTSRPIGTSSLQTEPLNFYDPRQLELQGRITF
ncbi:TonB-dependent receptor [Tunturiibacter empetritectus]|uniref:TonB-dependent transporter Oar-like beta-barrel domain-containing protein n=1 Tax=Tunturiibacter lichenicola TaxID=2051959 RepID=A0A852VGY5_9BACT|nr:TonB-dependent receptor [Edaphobacter lichenicola]NYF88736.1 hypothetical protein [Edaphobacter lichenicola]